MWWQVDFLVAILLVVRWFGGEVTVNQNFISASVHRSSRLFTVPYFLVRSCRCIASYRHGYLDFQMYQWGGCRDYSFGRGVGEAKPPPRPQ